MKNILFALFLLLSACTRYVYIIIPTQTKEIEKYLPFPKYSPSIGDNMPFGGIQIPNDFTLPYNRSGIIYIDTTKSRLTLCCGDNNGDDSLIINSNSIIRRILKD